MKLDSEEQRKLLTTFLEQVPVKATVKDMLGGGLDKIREILDAIKNAEIEEPEED